MSRLSDAVPYGDDATTRRHQDLQRDVAMQAAARRAARTQIGDGGVLKVDGTLQVTGDLEVPSGSLSSATNMTAGEDVVAGRDVLAGRHVDVTSNLDVGGTSTLDLIDSLATYNRLVTGSGSFRTMSVNILGHIGQTVSSRRYKQDIETAVVPRETLRKIRVVFFRYVALVPFAQEQQPWLLGLIAEEVHDLGLTWLVIYNDDGQPEALVDFALPFLGLLLAQSNADEIDALRSEIAELKGR